LHGIPLAAWWSALLAIILIDLVLAGDNAIVIALAARNLPAHLQKKAIVWGTVGAIVVRSVMTVGVVWLLKIPGLMLVGGLGLLWIAYKLLADDDAATTTARGQHLLGRDAHHRHRRRADGRGQRAGRGRRGARRHGPGDHRPAGERAHRGVRQRWCCKLVERFPIIIQLGAAVLAFTAAKMIVGEPCSTRCSTPCNARWSTYAVCIAGVLGAGWWVAARAPPPTGAG
jgi:predicted tellurium resistance membrane protein TerC